MDVDADMDDGYSTASSSPEMNAANQDHKSFTKLKLRDPILFDPEQIATNGIIIEPDIDAEEHLYSREGTGEGSSLDGFEDVTSLPGVPSCSADMEMSERHLSRDFEGLSLGAGRQELSPILDGVDTQGWNPMTPYSELIQHFTNVTDLGEIRKCIVSVGNGKKLPIHAVIWVEYEMWGEDMDDVLYRTKKPFQFRFFQPDIMTWFDLGMSTMEELETAWFMVQPEFGFRSGVIDLVPKDTALLFKIHVRSFEDSSVPGLSAQYPGEDLQAFKHREVVTCVSNLKQEAKYFMSGLEPRWRLAYERYRKALHFMDQYFVLDAALEQETFKESFNLHNNMALCTIKLGMFQRALFHCRKALQLPEAAHTDLCKLWYRRATAELEMGHPEMALKSTSEARKHSAYNTELKELEERIRAKLNLDVAVQTKLYRKMMPGLKIPAGNQN